MSSKVPSFEFPSCARCNRPVDRMTVERNHDDGSFRIAVHCHDRRQLLRVTQKEIDEYGGNPLVKISTAFTPMKGDDNG